MASLQEFLVPGGWTVSSWNPVLSLGLSNDNFKTQSGLLIGQVVSSNPEQPLCSLVWLNENNNLCSIPEIPFDTVSGTLSGEILMNLAGQPGVFCSLTLTLIDNGTHPKSLTGQFGASGTATPMEITGGPGTLAAQANAGPGGDIDIPPTGT